MRTDRQPARRRPSAALVLCLALALLRCSSLTGCEEGEGEGGDPCTEGEDCASGVCLKGVLCPGGATIDICGGARCTNTCTGVGEVCVRPMGLGQGYCYPTSACEGYEASVDALGDAVAPEGG